MTPPQPTEPGKVRMARNGGVASLGSARIAKLGKIATLIVVMAYGLVVASPAQASAVPTISVTSQTTNGNLDSYPYTETVPAISVSNAGPAQAAVDAATGSFVQSMVADFLALGSPPPNPPTSAVPTSQLKITVTNTYATERVISIVATDFEGWAFSAHPTTVVRSLNLDLSSGNTLSLTDLVDAQSLPQLASLISTLLPAAFTAHDSGSDCAADAGSVLQNLQEDASSGGAAVSLSNAGLVVNFQPYGLGSYASGCDVAVTVHYALLGGILQSAYMPAQTPSYGSTILANHPDSYFQFQDAPGSTTFQDSIPGGPPAVANGTPSLSPAGALGLSDGSLTVGDGYAVINPPTAGLGIPALPELAGSKPRTVELWFHTGDQNGTLFGAGSQFSAQDLEVTLTPGGLGNNPPKNTAGVFIEGFGNDIYLPDLPLADNNWHYLALTMTGQSVNVVADNAQPNGATWDGRRYSRIGAQPFILPHPPNTFGTPASVGGPGFSGSIDEVAVYPTVLSPATLHNHYAAGVGARGVLSMSLSAGDVYGVTNNSVDANLAQLNDGATNTNASVYRASVVWDLTNNPTVSTPATIQGIEGPAPPGPQPFCSASPVPCHPMPGSFEIHSSHSYSAAKNYQVRVTVTRNDGAKASIVLTAHISDQCKSSSKGVRSVASALTSGADPGSTIDSHQECFSELPWDRTLFGLLGPDETFSVLQALAPGQTAGGLPYDTPSGEYVTFATALAKASSSLQSSFTSQLWSHFNTGLFGLFSLPGGLGALSLATSTPFSSGFWQAAGSAVQSELGQCDQDFEDLYACDQTLFGISTSPVAAELFLTSDGGTAFLNTHFGSSQFATAYGQVLMASLNSGNGDNAANAIYTAVSNEVGQDHTGATGFDSGLADDMAQVVATRIQDFVPGYNGAISGNTYSPPSPLFQPTRSFRVLLAALQTSEGVATALDGFSNYVKTHWPYCPITRGQLCDTRFTDLSQLPQTSSASDDGSLAAWIGGALDTVHNLNGDADNANIAKVWATFGVITTVATLGLKPAVAGGISIAQSLAPSGVPNLFGTPETLIDAEKQSGGLMQTTLTNLRENLVYFLLHDETYLFVVPGSGTPLGPPPSGGVFTTQQTQSLLNGLFSVEQGNSCAGAPMGGPCWNAYFIVEPPGAKNSSDAVFDAVLGAAVNSFTNQWVNGEAQQ